MSTTRGVTWFRNPTDGDPATGTMNPVYDLLDRRVVHGGADDLVLGDVSGGTAAELLERVAGLAGAFRGLGVTTGVAVHVDLEDPAAEALARLAILRAGAVVTERSPVLAVVEADRMPAAHVPSVVVYGTEQTTDPTVFPWTLMLRAGLSDPAPVTPVAGTPALVALARRLRERGPWTCAHMVALLRGE